MNRSKKGLNEKKEKSLLKAIGSVLFAILASSHHWLHTLLIALGLTTFGSALIALPPSIRIIFLLISLVISVRFIFVAKHKWHHDRAVAWVYLISSIISIVLVLTIVPQTVGSMFDQPAQQPTENIHNDM